jgi:hypothetical protein
MLKKLARLQTGPQPLRIERSPSGTPEAHLGNK